MAGIVERFNEFQEVLEMANCAWLDVASAMEVHQCYLCILVTEPVGLDSAGKGNGLWGKVPLLREVVVRLGGRLVQVAALRERNESQLSAESSEGDIF